MKVRLVHFNIILLLLALASGCETADKKKELSGIRLHIESNGESLGGAKPVPIYRAAPVLVNVESSPFVDERDVVHAQVVDWMGGFAIQIKLNDHGTLMLENTTRLNPGRRIAVLCEFGETRWLAAPLISRPINSGELVFTPDATRVEAERIVRGLNAVAAEILKNSKN